MIISFLIQGNPNQLNFTGAAAYVCISFTFHNLQLLCHFQLCIAILFQFYFAFVTALNSKSINVVRPSICVIT